MWIDFMLERFCENRSKEAIVWRDRVYTYGWLTQRIEEWRTVIALEGVKTGAVVILEADFSPNAIALFLSLVDAGSICVPVTSAVESHKDEYIAIAQGEVSFAIDRDDKVAVSRLGNIATHELYEELKRRKHPGLVLFSSGSTGTSKAAVHDFIPLLDKFKVRRESLRTMTFLLYDHIGGVNTMLYALSNVGCIVTATDRSPDGVLSAVEKHGVELLPTSPTFMNLVLLSGAYKRHRLNSVRVVTYGTEPMPQGTLNRFREILPWARLQQTYGLSEVGILRSKSRSSDSLWMKVGGEGYDIRIVDGTLQIKAKSAMLGYLNAHSPFSDDGWMDTGDYVESDGDYIRIVGRRSDIINVGGEKVFPTEVEDVIQEMENVSEVTVYGERNPIVGNIVCARVTLIHQEDEREFRLRLREYCEKRIERYKVPVKTIIATESQHSGRFKKMRRT